MGRRPRRRAHSQKQDEEAAQQQEYRHAAAIQEKQREVERANQAVAIGASEAAQARLQCLQERQQIATFTFRLAQTEVDRQEAETTAARSPDMESSTSTYRPYTTQRRNFGTRLQRLEWASPSRATPRKGPTLVSSSLRCGEASWPDCLPKQICLNLERARRACEDGRHHPF